MKMRLERTTYGVLLVALCFSACTRDDGDETVRGKPQVADDHAVPATLPRTASPEGASVFFITPADGDTVSNPINIEFGINGMDVVKAGVDQPNSGHHHLLIDTDLPELGAPIPADANHVHFGDGSTTTEITLPPGKHELFLLLGDHQHIPHDPPLVSNPITITVE